jgi:plastocyanin
VTSVDANGNMVFDIIDAAGVIDPVHTLSFGPDGLLYDGAEPGTGGGGGSLLPGGDGSDGAYDPADGATLTGGVKNYSSLTLQAGRTIKGTAGELHYVQVSGDATLNGTINMNGRGNEGGNGGNGSNAVAAGNSSAGTAGSDGTSAKSGTAGSGGRGGGRGSESGGHTSGNGGDGGDGGNRGGVLDGAGGGAGGAGANVAGTTSGSVGSSATAVNLTMLARRVSHDFLVSLLGGAGGGGGGGGSGEAGGGAASSGGAGATTYADADGTGANGTAGGTAIGGDAGGGGGKGGRGGGVYVMVVRGNVSGTFTINANGAGGGTGGAAGAGGGNGESGGGGGGGCVLIVFYGEWSATLTCSVTGGTGPGGGDGETGFYAVINGNTGEVVVWGGSLATAQERASYAFALLATQTADVDVVMPSPHTHVPVDTTGGSFVPTVPEGVNVQPGDTVTFEDRGGNATAEPVTITMSGSDTVNGASTYDLDVDGESATLRYLGGTEWVAT